MQTLIQDLHAYSSSAPSTSRRVLYSSLLSQAPRTSYRNSACSESPLPDQLARASIMVPVFFSSRSTTCFLNVSWTSSSNSKRPILSGAGLMLKVVFVGDGVESGEEKFEKLDGVD